MLRLGWPIDTHSDRELAEYYELVCPTIDWSDVDRQIDEIFWKPESSPLDERRFTALIDLLFLEAIPVCKEEMRMIVNKTMNARIVNAVENVEMELTTEIYKNLQDWLAVQIWVYFDVDPYTTDYLVWNRWREDFLNPARKMVGEKMRSATFRFPKLNHVQKPVIGAVECHNCFRVYYEWLVTLAPLAKRERWW